MSSRNVRKAGEEAADAAAAKRSKASLVGSGARVLMVDNFDSFTHNIVQYLSELGAEVTVRRNDAVTAAEILETIKPTHVVISPGPGRPAEAGTIVSMARELAGKVPVLGVCLGHQAIVEAYGGRIVRAAEIVHGKTSPVQHDGKGVFAGLPENVQFTRYHSLVAADGDEVPAELEVTARCAALTDQAPAGYTMIMGVRHRELTVEGVQFHPESVLSEGGRQLLGNFLAVSGGKW